MTGVTPASIAATAIILAALIIAHSLPANGPGVWLGGVTAAAQGSSYQWRLNTVTGELTSCYLGTSGPSCSKMP